MPSGETQIGLTRLTALLGIATLCMSIVLGLILPREMPWLPEGFFTPIIAFEFVANDQELQRMFGEAGTPLRAALAAAMDLGNRWDFLFMTLYSLFLALFSWQSWRCQPSAWLQAAMVLVALAWIGDVQETRELLAMTAALDGSVSAAHFQCLHWYTWIKWLALAIALALLAMPVSRQSKWQAGLCVLPLPLGLIALADRSVWNEVFAISVGVAFFVLTWRALRMARNV